MTADQLLTAAAHEDAAAERLRDGIGRIVVGLSGWLAGQWEGNPRLTTDDAVELDGYVESLDKLRNAEQIGDLQETVVPRARAKLESVDVPADWVKTCPECGDEHRELQTVLCWPCVEFMEEFTGQNRGLLGGVYFVRSGSFVKIGVSSNALRRVLSNACAWNPHEYEPLGWIAIADTRQAGLTELRLHRRFNGIRYRAEWFRATPELLEFAKANARPWPRRLR